MAENNLKLYGTEWCTKTSMLKNFLQGEWIAFDYHNVDTDPDAAETVKKLYDGKLKFPTITFSQEHLKNPSVGELRKFIQEKGIE
jgi:glutaredoxin